MTALLTLGGGFLLAVIWMDLMFDVPPQTGFMLIEAWLAERGDPELNNGAVWDAARHLVLPAIVLGTIPLAVIARMTRSSMLEVLREDYVRTARAKGLSPMRVILKAVRLMIEASSFGRSNFMTVGIGK